MNKLKKNKNKVFFSSPVKLSSNHLLAIEGMEKSEIQKLIERADYFANLDKHTNTKVLQGTLYLMYFLKTQLVQESHLNLLQEDLVQKLLIYHL